MTKRPDTKFSAVSPNGAILGTVEWTGGHWQAFTTNREPVGTSVNPKIAGNLLARDDRPVRLQPIEASS